MPLRRFAAISLMSVLVLAGCGSDTASKDDNGDTPAADETSEPSDDPTVDEATDPLGEVSDEEFAAALVPVRQQIEETTDLCGVLAIFNSTNNLPQPTGPAQMEEAVDITVVLFSGVGDALAAEDAEAGAALTSLAESLRPEAEAAGYPDDFFATSETFNGGEFNSAMEAASTAAATACPDLVGGESTPIEEPASGE